MKKGCLLVEIFSPTKVAKDVHFETCPMSRQFPYKGSSQWVAQFKTQHPPHLSQPTPSQVHGESDGARTSQYDPTAWVLGEIGR